MGKRQSAFSTAWAAIGLLAILHVVVFDLTIITARDTLQVQYTPDDAYYYLALARNYATLRTWTFDGGHSATSGFHPLLAYLLSLLYVVMRPTSGEFVRYSLVLGSVVTTAALLIAWVVGRRLQRPSYMALLALFVTSRNFTYNSVSAMEWPLVLLFSILYWIQFLPRRSAEGRTWTYVSSFSIGFLGSLARSDFGLLPLSLFLASLLVRLLLNKRAHAALAFWGLLGATTGLFAVLAHTYAVTGGILQSSARMKAYWMQIYGSAHWYAVRMMMGVLNLIPIRSAISGITLVLLGVLPLLGLAVILKAWREKRLFGLHIPAETLVLLIASALCIVGYVILYSRSGSIPPWYTVSFITPLTIIPCILSTYIEALLRKERIAWGASAIMLPVLVLNIATLYPVDGSNAPMPHQQIMLRAGRDLGQRELDGQVGSWNAGIIGYYQGGTVVNLDGLVNDDIYPYAVNNELPVYISERNIQYVIDFENVFLDQKRRLRGGYEDADFITRLEPIKVYDDGEYYWKRLTLYHIAPR